VMSTVPKKENALHCGEVSSRGSDGVLIGYLYTVSAGGAANAADNGMLYPFFTGYLYLVIVGRGFGGLHAGGEDTGSTVRTGLISSWPLIIL
jgi:hypothetical protein